MAESKHSLSKWRTRGIKRNGAKERLKWSKVDFKSYSSSPSTEGKDVNSSDLDDPISLLVAAFMASFLRWLCMWLTACAYEHMLYIIGISKLLGSSLCFGFSFVSSCTAPSGAYWLAFPLKFVWKTPLSHNSWMLCTWETITTWIIPKSVASLSSGWDPLDYGCRGIWMPG